MFERAFFARILFPKPRQQVKYVLDASGDFARNPLHFTPFAGEAFGGG